MTARDVCFSVQPLQGLSGTKWLLFTVFGGKWLFFTSFGGKCLLFTVFFKKGYTKIRVLKKRESRTNFFRGASLSRSRCDTQSVSQSGFWQILCHAKLCKVIQSYAKSCKVMHSPEKACLVMQSHPKSCKVLQSHVNSCKVMKSYTTKIFHSPSMS